MNINLQHSNNLFVIIVRIVMPKKKSAEDALAALEEKQLALLTEQTKLVKLQELLSKLNIEFKLKMDEKEQLIIKVTKILNTYILYHVIKTIIILTINA